MLDQPTKKQLNAKLIYTNLMEEAKTRLETIRILLNANTSFPDFITQDLCLLQMRMLCEIIALGCLVAHEEIEITKTPQIRSEASANNIIKKLEALNLDFYPKPISITSDANNHHFAALVKDGYLTKEELLSLYAKCNSSLHMGNMKNLIKGKRTTVDLSEIYILALKILKLLNQHRISLLGDKKQFICLMQTEGALNVQVVIAEIAVEQIHFLPQEKTNRFL